ncbi:hypothetical protein AOZ06_50345 [Kibdelosporangium phytohabitans]|uniref:Uncharacterized protein n=1 Tax=Kibdelosporangium phytohabitans TaxID=860235 RepID=A0A0N7F5E3_9PSEU|nr:hypothetical protein AOZ06_50345 [Kibdelosporangium phytohabitans]
MIVAVTESAAGLSAVQLRQTRTSATTVTAPGGSTRSTRSSNQLSSGANTTVSRIGNSTANTRSNTLSVAPANKHEKNSPSHLPVDMRGVSSPATHGTRLSTAPTRVASTVRTRSSWCSR